MLHAITTFDAAENQTELCKHTGNSLLRKLYARTCSIHTAVCNTSCVQQACCASRCWFMPALLKGCVATWQGCHTLATLILCDFNSVANCFQAGSICWQCEHLQQQQFT